MSTFKSVYISKQDKASNGKIRSGGRLSRIHWLSGKILAGVLVFLATYVAAVWFKFNEPHTDVTAIVQGGAGENAAIPARPVVIAPELDAIPPSRPDTSRSRLPEARRESVVPVLPVTKSTGDRSAQAVTSEATPDVPADHQDTGPEGDLTISGHVLDRSGTAVQEIKLIAKASYLFDRDKGSPAPVYRYQREAISGYDGAYDFERLADGEYHISTVATERYPSVQVAVRAGVDFADLILTGQHALRVHGLVTTAAGEPLVGVRVSPVVPDAPVVSSGNEGRYSFEVKVLDNAQGLTVRATRESYEDKEVRLDLTQSEAVSAPELNIVMTPDEDATLAEVRGQVTGPEGEPVAGQRIGLSSAGVRQNYHATTDTEGRFVLRGVEPGDDYMLAINAVAAYKDYFQRELKVPKSGLTLNIKLEPLDTGTLSGQMVNVFGTPVPNFTMVLQTKEISYYNQRVLGDSSGQFTVEKAPAGELILRTKSTPYYTIEGLRLAVGAELQVPIVLDWGYDAIQGRVVDQRGYPVAVASLSLTWSHQQAGLRSTSRRSTAADEQGNFRFTQLGPGSHRLVVNAEGYNPVTVNHDVAQQGSELEVKLVAK